MTETLDLFGNTTEDTSTSVASSRRRRNRKSDTAYRTISEVAKSIGVATHVLRFWETKFEEIQPLKRSGGRRYYRPEDITIIKRIQDLLHNEGYTIKGVQALLQKEGQQSVEPQTSGNVAALPEVLDRLYKIRQILAA